MPSSPSVAAKLFCHPESQRSEIIRGIDVHVKALMNGELILSYNLTGDLERLRIPPSVLPRRVDGLWRHTCFEAFIATVEGPEYFELNFSPSGEWAAYQFCAYRDGAAMADDAFWPKISVERGSNRLITTASVPWERLPTIRREQLVRLGLSAVIESDEGSLSYWALEHPCVKPDFHHENSFTLELALPVKSA